MPWSGAYASDPLLESNVRTSPRADSENPDTCPSTRREVSRACFEERPTLLARHPVDTARLRRGAPISHPIARRQPRRKEHRGRCVRNLRSARIPIAARLRQAFRRIYRPVQSLIGMHVQIAAAPKMALETRRVEHPGSPPVRRGSCRVIPPGARASVS